MSNNARRSKNERRLKGERIAELAKGLNLNHVEKHVVVPCLKECDPYHGSLEELHEAKYQYEGKDFRNLKWKRYPVTKIELEEDSVHEVPSECVSRTPQASQII
ncbi:Hypothetical predicted protein [Olea europaea subsp. europaea]|uniref:Uncharacterized protein n=1 Tax=Olea europaea subsp. europaea TaxID=158383 RepID=A0A8S0SSC7_OLEEU|nr:Hypothetical predicted protein [Olea europaea subsp. europaea]